MNSSNLYSLLYLEVNLISIVLVIIIAVKTMGMTKMVAQRNFIRGLICLVIFFISDMAWVLINYGLIPYSKFALMAVSNVYFLFSAFTTYSWFVYFEYLQDSPFVKSRRNLLISATCLIMQLLIIIINQFTGILYYINDNGEYTRGPLYMLLYLFAYIYVVVASIRALVGFFKTDNYEKKKKLIKLATFPVAPGIGGVLQLFFPKIPIVCAMLALAVLILYLDWLEEMISVDPLTRLNNRKQLTFIYEQWLRNNEDKTPIYLLMIDADHFKEINDTYGHVEGDAALVRIADALRTSCKLLKKRATIARYGGDEFVVLAKADNDETIHEFIEKVQTELVELNKESKSEYDLQVCIGIAKTDTIEDKPIKELIVEADEQLYDRKRKRTR